MPESVADVAPDAPPIHRLGLEWCVEHQQPVLFCAHNWHTHNSVRKYAGLVANGRQHPFRQSGGPITGARQGPDALAEAMAAAPVERIALSNVVATQAVEPSHIGLMLKGKAPAPRTGNHNFESADVPTVVRTGKHFVVADGHHRLAAAWARGETHSNARVLSGVDLTFDNGDGFFVHPD